MQEVSTPRDAEGRVDYDKGWALWTDTIRYYPSAVHRRRLIADWLVAVAPTSILDAGCGTGALLSTLRERLPSARYVGTDQAGRQMAQNAEQLPWATFHALDLGKAALGEQFDAVVCTEVLEHIEDDDAALDHLIAMTGKHLLLTVPAGKMYPLEIGFGHIRHYELDALCRRIEAKGLRIVKAEAWGFPFMTAFKWASNLNPEAVMKNFGGGGSWGFAKRSFAAVLTGLFYLNVPMKKGPQLFILASR